MNTYIVNNFVYKFVYKLNIFYMFVSQNKGSNQMSSQLMFSTNKILPLIF